MKNIYIFDYIQICIFIIICSIDNSLCKVIGNKLLKNKHREKGNVCPACLNKNIYKVHSFPYVNTFLFRWSTSIRMFFIIVPKKYWYSYFDLFYCKACKFEFIASSYEGLTEYIEKQRIYQQIVLLPYYQLTQNYYSDEYLYQLKNNVKYALNDVDLMRKKHIEIIKNFKNVTSLLEIGSNKGAFVYLIHKMLPKLTILGSEINESYIRDCIKRYPDIKVVTPAELQKMKGNYDCVYMNDVLEHIWDVDTFLSSIRKIISGKGYVFVTTPNLECSSAKKRKYNWWSYIVPHHCQFFTKKSLMTLMKRYSFSYVTRYYFSDECSYIFRYI